MHPYPYRPQQDLEDSKTFALWIACIVGSENLVAFYHKPKVSNVDDSLRCVFLINVPSLRI